MSIVASNRPFKGKVASDPEELRGYLASIKDKQTIYFPFWSWKVPIDILSKHTCIGFHSAPLPYGRGGSPIQNMIRLGYETTEVCMFQLTANLDEGDVIMRRSMWLGGNLGDVISRISGIIEYMITLYGRGTISSTSDTVDYSKVPLKFHRITNNTLLEMDSLKAIYDEIRMRDDDNHPKAIKYHGKYTIEFTNAELKGEEVTARVRIYQK